MRLLASLTAVATVLAGLSTAQAASLHTDWEKFKAGHALRRLSADGQRALADIATAHDLLAQGKTDAAIPSLYDAQKRLAAAGKARQNFIAAESDLHPAPQHPAAPGHAPVTAPTAWIPVGGEFIVTDTLAPEQKSAVATANQQLKAGQTKDAAQTMQIVDQNTDFILALAPLAQTQGALNRATVFTEGRDAKDAVDALDQIAASLVFVSEDVNEAAVPAPAKH
ncbi:hypothetical protein AA103196_2657 [Ameyamaea chiangmaiensis NBRC 103196]|uniref:YfdX family protein n=1 Tax=Ameyamaea chiangmaiensis TaxID=442969 RepID=A0A850P7R2_9PROT|nr:YfdX family protein [Ameyamaea chiangmaiensis]MBS4074147.1 YfdX family protein [Ameyamaea chiangmaiensis]NVN39958.1 YfdX family protein [Ameyamaea chiangmaiensis]GBQ71036.1 hypothetical protein AA103196_2657 [Ameyamaea chiangmaiensis NBRC 103196]